MTLTDFLLARIAEDEEGASLVHRESCIYLNSDDTEPCDCGYPARVLAECEAKRRIVSSALSLNEQADAMSDDEPNHASFQGQALAWRVALRFLALPYAGHPDYDTAWRS